MFPSIYGTNDLDVMFIFIESSSGKNLARSRVLRYNNIFCCHHLKLSPLNFSGFTPREMETGRAMGIIGIWATLRFASWEDLVTMELLDSVAIFPAVT